MWLKRIRVVVAVVFFLAVSYLFLDFGNSVPTVINSFLVSLQVVPSFTRTVVYFSLASVGLFFVIGATLIYGRIYCSTICPLGTLQDIVIRIAKRMNRRRRFQYQKPYYVIHYVLFTITTILAFIGSVLLLDLLEPFSNFGRILSNLASPIVVLANNALVLLLEYFGIFSLYHIPFLHINVITILVPIIFLGLIAYLSYKSGRLFCNLLCPVGALLGILSRFSVYKIVIDKSNCKECGLCERVCKAACIKTETLEIDFAACVGCFNCLDACPTMGMSYKARWRTRSIENNPINEERRKVMLTSLVPTVGLIFPFLTKEDSTLVTQSGFDESKRHPISPPGSVSVERFSNLCTACHLCVSSCPTQVLYPSLLDYGITGIFQPKMNYSESYCNYDCVICSQVCPTGAILPLDSVSKKEVQIGKANLIKDDCIVVTKKTDCGACSEHCPTKAVHMIPYDHLRLPEINNEICVGCGACEHACPTKPRKAIYVNANVVHLKAKKPQIQKIENTLKSNQDFPF